MKTKRFWIQGLIITSTCCLVGAAAAIHLYPRTMSNDKAKARQDMQQILAAVREYRAQNNGNYPPMANLPAEHHSTSQPETTPQTALASVHAPASS